MWIESNYNLSNKHFNFGFLIALIYVASLPYLLFSHVIPTLPTVSTSGILTEASQKLPATTLPKTPLKPVKLSKRKLNYKLHDNLPSYMTKEKLRGPSN